MLSQTADPWTLYYHETGMTAANISHGMWVDEHGGIVAIAGASSSGTATESGAVMADGNLLLIKPDGQIVRWGSRRAWTGIGWDYSDRAVLTGTTGINRVSLPYTQEAEATITGITAVNCALLAGRAIYFSAANNVTTTTLTGASSATECVITTGNTGPGRIFPADLTGKMGIGSRGADGRPSLWWLCDTNSGRLYLYDAIALAEVAGYRTGFGAACSMPCYSRKHDLFACIISGALRVYANEPAAATVSRPAFTPNVGTPHSVSLVRTILHTLYAPAATTVMLNPTTVSLWFNYTDVSTTHPLVGGSLWGKPGGTAGVAVLPDGRVYASYRPGARAVLGTATAGTWNHICAVYDGVTGVSPEGPSVTFYFNGVAAGGPFDCKSSSVGGGLRDAYVLYFGYDEGIEPSYVRWTGYLDEIAVWRSTALNATQVAELYALGLDNGPASLHSVTPTSYWPMDAITAGGAGTGYQFLDEYSLYPIETLLATVANVGVITPPAVYTGHQVTVSSRVLGSLSEPCAGRVVVFSATSGTFPRPNVLTDADGYAETDYRAPWDATQDDELDAELVE